MSANFEVAKRRFLLTLCVGSIVTVLVQPRAGYAAGTIEFDGAGSLAAFLACIAIGGAAGPPLDSNPGLCRTIALAVDPPSRNVTSLSTTLQYDTSRFTFDRQGSGFLGPFSLDGGNAPAVVREGTLPVDLLPSSGLNPGHPLPGSSVALTDTGGKVTLDYQLSSPIGIDQDANFFLFSFNFNDPPLVTISQSTATYFSNGTGLDFNQTAFSCATVDFGSCGSTHPVSGITLDLAVVPEPTTLLLWGTTMAGLGLAARWRRRRQN
jgi:hypothetical protein